MEHQQIFVAVMGVFGSLAGLYFFIHRIGKNTEEAIGKLDITSMRIDTRMESIIRDVAELRRDVADLKQRVGTIEGRSGRSS